MKNYVRYFLSQYVGKAIVTVESSGQDGAHIRIDVANPSERSAAFWLPADKLATLTPDPDQWQDAAARVAIHQAHNILDLRGERCLFNATHALDVALTPWTGELARVPSGGVSQAHQASGTEELRKGWSGGSSGR